MMKRFLIIAAAVILCMPALTLAEASPSPRPSITPRSGKGKNVKNTAAVQAATMTRLKTKADKEIQRRLTIFNALSSRIASTDRFSTQTKASLQADIQGEITKLNTLKTKIDGDTDLTTLRADVKSLASSHSAFTFIIVKGYLLAQADTMNDAITEMNALADQLQTQIDAQKSQGKDVTQLTIALTDLRAQTTDAQKQYQAIQNLLLPITPDKIPTTNSVLQSARTMLQKGRHDLATARDDASTITDGLKNL